MRILCFGDSNTYGYDPRSYFGEPYRESWPDLLARETGHTVFNAGQNGREIPHTPWQYQQLEALLACYPSFDLMTVMLGGNDLLQNPRFTAADVAARMEDFFMFLCRRFPASSLLLIAPVPMQRGAWVNEERLLQESDALCDAYRELSARLGVHFADSRKWSVEKVFDGVHFSAQGHASFAKGLAKSLPPTLEHL